MLCEILVVIYCEILDVIYVVRGIGCNICCARHWM